MSRTLITATLEAHTQQRRPLSQPWLPIWGIIHGLCFSPSSTGSYHSDLLPTALGEKKQLGFVFIKEGNLKSVF